MTAEQIERTNTEGIRDLDAIFILHRANYRPFHAYNSTYINKAIDSLKRR